MKTRLFTFTGPTWVRWISTVGAHVLCACGEPSLPVGYQLLSGFNGDTNSLVSITREGGDLVRPENRVGVSFSMNGRNDQATSHRGRGVENE